MSFVSKNFKLLLDLKCSKLNKKYIIELANRQKIEICIIVKGCSLTVENHPFSIDFSPTTLGSFDVVIGMDWFSKNHPKVVCHRKIVRLPDLNDDFIENKVLKGYNKYFYLKIYVFYVIMKQCVRPSFQGTSQII